MSFCSVIETTFNIDEAVAVFRGKTAFIKLDRTDHIGIDGTENSKRVKGL